jgi:hypothetical protein
MLRAAKHHVAKKRAQNDPISYATGSFAALRMESGIVFLAANIRRIPVLRFSTSLTPAPLPGGEG